VLNTDRAYKIPSEALDAETLREAAECRNPVDYFSMARPGIGAAPAHLSYNAGWGDTLLAGECFVPADVLLQLLRRRADFLSNDRYLVTRRTSSARARLLQRALT